MYVLLHSKQIGSSRSCLGYFPHQEKKLYSNEFEVEKSRFGYGCRPSRMQRINSQTEPFWYRISNRKTKSIKVDTVNMELVKIEYAQTLFSISYKRMIRSFEYYNVLNFSRLSINIFFQITDSLLWYSQFHKTVPKSCLQMHWI